ncbi:MAG TPA: class I SAM-dependent methyltransferase [Labilithrix sp.]|nr:class I SAM-dependent methyltransferase [Labilithrix sp.]
MNLSPLSAPEPWDHVADGYADEAPWLVGPFSMRAAALARLDARTKVVDVACGPGTTTLRIASRVAHVSALDFSAPMISRLRRDLEARGLRNVTAVAGDGQALPFPDVSFDVAFSMFGLMFFPDRARGFTELWRVLRPGGTAVVSSWAPLARSPLMQAMFGALRAADPAMPEPRPDPSSLENPEVFEREMRAAGFVDVAIHPHEEAIAVDDAEALWDRMVRSSAPLVMLRRKLGEATWATRAEVARAWLRERIGPTPTALATVAFLGVGRRPETDGYASLPK